MRALFVFALLTISSSAEAVLSISLRDPLIHDLLPPNSKLDCRILQQPSFGYLLERSEDKNIRISVINDNKNEGDKSAFTAVIMSEELSYIYLKHHKREGDFGRYIEFIISRQRKADSKSGFAGKAAFTEAFYSKNAEGQEVEELIPQALSAINCTKK